MMRFKVEKRKVTEWGNRWAGRATPRAAGRGRTFLLTLLGILLTVQLMFLTPERVYATEALETMAALEPVIWWLDEEELTEKGDYVRPVTQQWVTPLPVSAKAAILVEAATGQVLFARRAQDPLPPASTTKIMTAILALETATLDKEVQVSKRAASRPPCRLGLIPGQKYSLRYLLAGALLRSGNDASAALAEAIAGSEEEFARLMTLRAKALGARHTNFVNASGLPARGHYSTAYDLAVITRYALANPLFRQMVAARQLEVKGINGKKRLLTNTNRLLHSYEGADGVKTGTTVEAGKCLVASATRNGRQLIAVVLNSRDRYRDCCLLLDYGFRYWQPQKVIAAGETIVDLPEGPVLTADRELWVSILACSDNNDKVKSIPGSTGSAETFFRGEIKREVEVWPEIREGMAAGKLRLWVDNELVAYCFLRAVANQNP